MIGGLSGDRMLLGLAIGIIVLIFLVLKTKVQAFLALIISTIIVGVVGGMPLTNITLDDGKTFGIINSITTGFGGTLGSIGIIIGFGVMMGQIFEVTGAAKRMAFTFLKLFGKKREEEALALTGFLVSIPIFCDSGFVVLSPIAKAISKATKKSVIGLGVALAAGLVITHSLVPPTPGPLGVCGIFGVDVGKFILMTIVLAIPMAIACIAYARLYLSKKYYQIPNEDGEFVSMPYQEPTYEDTFKMEEEGLPSTLQSFLPLIVPIVLILINTIASALGKTTGPMEILIFLGQPIVAVGLGLLVAIFGLGRNLDRHTALSEMEKGMCSATSFLRNWDSILEKKRANLRSISEPARLRQPPPRSTGAAHARGRAQSIREERRIAAPPVLFALLWVRLLPALYGPFCGPLRPFGGCPWGVTPPARECLPPAPPDTRRRG